MRSIWWRIWCTPRHNKDSKKVQWTLLLGPNNKMGYMVSYSLPVISLIQRWKFIRQWICCGLLMDESIRRTQSIGFYCRGKHTLYPNKKQILCYYYCLNSSYRYFLYDKTGLIGLICHRCWYHFLVYFNNTWKYSRYWFQIYFGSFTFWSQEKTSCGVDLVMCFCILFWLDLIEKDC